MPLRVADAGWAATALGVAATALGVIEAIFAVAAIGGTLCATAIRPGRPAMTAFVVLAGQGLAYALVAVPSPSVVGVAMAAIGLTAGCASVWLSGEFARVIDPTYLGRAAAIATLGDPVLTPLATPAFGTLTAEVGIRVSPAVLAVPMTALCLGTATRPRIRALATARERRGSTGPVADAEAHSHTR